VYFSPGAGGDEGGGLVLLNRRGERLPALLPEGQFVHPMFSPAGTAIVAEREFSIWTIDLVRGTSMRVSTGPRMGWPAWSADGKRIFYGSERAGPWQVWSRAADGSDEERQISKTNSSLTPTGVSPSGTEILVQPDNKDTGSDVEVMDMNGTIQSLVRTDGDDMDAAFSPDARWIAYASDESGQSEVYVRPRSGPGRWQISTQGGAMARWVLGDEIAYLQGTKIMTVAVKTSPSFEAGTPRLLFEAHASDFDLTRDGRVLIVQAPDPSTGPGRLNVVVNWFEEIKKR